MARGSQAGTPTQPTVIKSWKRQPRASFDGENTQGPLIDVLGSGVFGGLVVQNIEIARAKGLGMRIMGSASNVGSQTQRADVISVYAHDTVADASLGTGGAITMHMEHSFHQYTVHNCKFVNNDVGHSGAPENRGSLTVVAETGLSADKVADPGSTMTIYENSFDSEEDAIRHKHGGNVNVEAHHSIIRNSTTAFFVRIPKTHIHHNLVIGGTQALWLFDHDNRQASMDYFFEHNTIYNANGLVKAIDDTFPGEAGAQFTRKLTLHNNLFVARAGADGVLLLGVPASPFAGVSVSSWIFQKQLYDLSSLAGSVPNFLYHRQPGGPAAMTPVGFAPAMSDLHDTTSFASPAQLVNPAGGDYRPSPTSPAVNAASDGGDIGALVH